MVELFLFSIAVTPTPLQPPIYWVLGALSMRVKQPMDEADHSPAFNVRVKNAAHPYVFMALCLINHRDNFTFFNAYQ
jgi:hypothetical protein